MEKQKTRSHSFVFHGAEYAVATLVAKEIIWLRRLLKELNKGPTNLKCDNKSCILLTENPVLRERTKHIEVKKHFIRRVVEKKEIVVHIRGYLDSHKGRVRNAQIPTLFSNLQAWAKSIPEPAGMGKKHSLTCRHGQKVLPQSW